jgi:hypothetical protein
VDNFQAPRKTEHRGTAKLKFLSNDAAVHFDAKPNGSLSEALANPDRLDHVLIERAVTRLSDPPELMTSLGPGRPVRQPGRGLGHLAAIVFNPYHPHWVIEVFGR